MLGIWLVRKEAVALGSHLQKKLGGTLFCPWENQEKSNKELFQENFSKYSKWILVMTTGIAVRFLADLPKSKYVDPAVVVLDEAGRNAISLLSGHEGGANHLAYQVANSTEATPIITTATETLKPLILGIGCRRGVSYQQIEVAVQSALTQVGKTLEEVREIATIDVKADEVNLLLWCEKNKLELRIISRSLVKKRPWVTTPSSWVEKNIGVVGVCEPVALLASHQGEIILEKTALNGVTVAIIDDSPVFYEQ